MISSGQKFELEFSYSQSEVNAFAALTGDNNPLHLDSAYAADTVFKKPIIHGILGGSVFSKILGTEFPGPGTVYLSQSLQFKRPMFVDIPYKAVVTVKEIDLNKNIAVLDTLVVDKATNKPVITGEATVLNKIRITV